jgi:hypothetical protein
MASVPACGQKTVSTKFNGKSVPQEHAQKLDVAWTGKGYQFAMDANHAAANGILSASDSRPFVWTVMGWAGVQRYAVTWAGDQSGSWDYIRWHIPTLIGSGLSGWLCHRRCGWYFRRQSETYTRDLQWKTFTPVLMGMSGWSKASANIRGGSMNLTAALTADI